MGRVVKINNVERVVEAVDGKVEVTINLNLTLKVEDGGLTVEAQAEPVEKVIPTFTNIPKLNLGK